MVAMDVFAHAFGLDSKSDDVWTTLGKVTAVHGATVDVILGGSATPTECEAYCLPKVGDIVFVVISQGRARAIASKMGNVTLVHEGDSTEADNGLASNSNKYLQFVDENNLFVGWVASIMQSSGTEVTQIAARKRISGSNVDNLLALSVQDDGTRTVTFTDKQPWLDALGVGAVESDSTSTAQSLASGTGKSIASVSLAKGNWLVMGHTNMASNATGIRSLGIGTTGGTFTNSDMSTVTMSATNGSETRMNTMTLVQPSATTTYYLNAYQNSGGSLDAKTAVMVAVRLG